MIAADLHVHTTNSDGTLSLAGVRRAARAAGVDAVAVTDHDRLHPGLGSPVADCDGLTVVHGVELRVDGGDQRLDLLGYGATRTDALVAELERLQADRVERGRAIVANVESALGIALDVDVGPGFGRPDVARAVAAHPETDYDVQGVFDDLIADGAPAYVPRDVPSFERGRELLADACPVVGLAHPLRYDDPTAALDRAASLDAVELYYPYEGDPDPTPVRRAADRHDWLVTGGSDAHDDGLGRAGLGPAEWERVRDRLSG
jgi:predicted metal-dependent phosphoesterase TrpH